MKVLAEVIFMCGVLLGNIHGKVFTRCGLTQELINLGFPRSYVANWVCLVESESGKDTSKEINKANGGKGLGLFQIGSKEWCTYSKAGGKCNMKCEDLLNEDLSDDASCAKKVEKQNGFRGWDGWRRSCYKRPAILANIASTCLPPVKA